MQTDAFDSKILFPFYKNIVDNIDPNVISTTSLTVAYFGGAKNELNW